MPDLHPSRPMTDPVGAGAPETIDRQGAFPRLDQSQLERLRALGELVPVSPGDVLFAEGESDYPFFAIESGSVAIVRGYGTENRVIAVHRRHRFLGEINLLTGSASYLTAVAVEPGEVTRVPASTLRKLVSRDQDLSNLLLQAYMARRTILVELGAGVKVIGSRHSEDAFRLREFLARNRMPYERVDLEGDAEAEELLRHLGICPADLPVVIGAGSVLRNPSVNQLGAMLGLSSRGAAPKMCDVVIVGGGPAGLAAAVYGASEGLDTQAIDAVAFGGQASTSARIENYLGFPTGISGSELAERATMQARRFGARLVVPAEAVNLVPEHGHFAIELADGETVRGRTVIVATGAHYRKLPIDGLDRFESSDVFYAATVAEAQACTAEPVVVVGGGNSAGQAAMFLSKHASSCHLLIRGGDLSKSMSQYLIDEIDRREQVELETFSEVVDLRGNGSLESVVVRDARDGSLREMPARRLFVFIGASPHTDWLGGHVALDEHGFLMTGPDVVDEDAEIYRNERPYILETSQPGLFAVGDVHSGSIKRVASAVGEGSMSIRLVHQRLADR